MSDTPGDRGAHLAGGIAEARRALLDWVDEAGDRGRTFLQVRLLLCSGARYEIRHVGDLRRPVASLRTDSDPFAARRIAGVTARGDHRPLKTAPNLRRGWRLADLDARGLWTALDYLYPACAVHWYAGRRGTLRVTHWREVARRQSGMYSAVGRLSDAALRNTVRACCGDAVCLRRVAWGLDYDVPLDLGAEGGAIDGDAPVPCPEACSLFVSFARTTLVLERQPRTAIPRLGTLSAQESEQIRAVIGAAGSRTLGRAREGEFDDPTNERRVRYLAARLAEVAPETAAGTGVPCEGCPRAAPCTACPVAS